MASNSGEVVTIPSDIVKYGGAGNVAGQNLILDKFNQAFNLTEEYSDLLENYLGVLYNMAQNIAMPSDIESLYGSVVIDDLIPIDMTAIPDLGTLTLPGFDETTFPLLPMLRPAPSADFSYDTPAKPDAVNAIVSYDEAAYNSAIYNQLLNKLVVDLVDGADGLTTEQWDAMVALRNEETRAANEKAYRVALNAASSNGFEYPEESVVAIEQEMGKEILRQETKNANEVLAINADLTQKNNQFAISSSLTFEQLLRQFHNDRENRTLQADIATADAVLKNYSAAIQGFKIEWEGVATQMQALKTEQEVVIAANQNIIDGYKIAMDGAVAESGMIATERKSLVDGYKGEVDAYSAKVNAQAAWYKALTEQQKSQVAHAGLELQKVNGEIDAKIKSYISVNSLQERIVEGMVNVAAQVVASSMVAVSTSVNHSSSTSESLSENYSHGDNLGEQHVYEHDPDA